MIGQNWIGCDVSKETLDFFDAGQGRHCRIANEVDAITAFVGRLRAGVDFVVMEATGTYDRLLRHALADAGVAFSRHNPEQTHHFSRSAARRAKTDRLDAVMLADYGRLHRPAADPVPDRKRERLQALARRRDQLVEIRAKQKKHLAEAFDDDVAADIEALIAQLDERIRALEAIIRTAIDEAGRSAEDYALMTSAPGVAQVTALTLLAHMPELGQRSPKAIAALAGLAPIDNASGKHRRRSTIAAGRARVRRALYMAALASIKARSRFKATYDAIAARSGSRKVAIIAVARKLIVALNAMIRDRKRFA
jgi:transposase